MNNVRLFSGFTIDLVWSTPNIMRLNDSLLICWTNKDYQDASDQEKLLGKGHYSMEYNYN